MPAIPTSEILRAAIVLGPHATLRTVAAAVGMEVPALRARCVEEGIGVSAAASRQLAAAPGTHVVPNAGTRGRG